jgi:RNA polymerase sigma-70 factor (ECF subfamily)
MFAPMRKCSDEELMKRVSADADEDAFNELYRRHARRLQGFFFRMLAGNDELAADFTQEVFLRMWSARTRYRAGNSVATWLFAMAYNLCKNEYRHQSRAVVENVVADDMIPEQAYEEDYSLRIDNDILDQALCEQLDRLHPDARLLFALRYEEEFAVAQIASILEIPEGTVKSRLHSLMKHLRLRLANYIN